MGDFLRTTRQITRQKASGKPSERMRDQRWGQNLSHKAQRQTQHTRLRLHLGRPAPGPFVSSCLHFFARVGAASPLLCPFVVCVPLRVP